MQYITKEELALKGMRFHALHGVYDIERRIERLFIVDIKLELNLSEEVYQDKLEGTVDYQSVHEVVKICMNQPRKLIETLAFNINQAILNRFELVNKAEVKVVKTNPPIIADMDAVEYTLVSVR